MTATSKTVALRPDARRARAAAFEYSFPALRGVQAGRDFYVSTCPLPLVVDRFAFDDEDLVPELRAQRALNRSRVPELARYVVENPDDYVFSALTVSIDGRVSFEPFDDGEAHAERMGILRIHMDARFLINDGQHRRAALAEALEQRPGLRHESIAVVFYVDAGLRRCQQMFADLNRYAVRPSRSLGVLYDHRDDLAGLTRLMTMKSSLFRDLVDREKNSLSARSRALFTLSALYASTRALVRDLPEDVDALELITRYWESVAEHIPEWRAVRDKQITAGDVRADFIHAHGVALHALGHAGRALVAVDLNPESFVERLAPLAGIDWSKRNTALWEGRALVGGKLAKGNQNVTLTTNVILRALGLQFDAEQARVEEAWEASRG